MSLRKSREMRLANLLLEQRYLTEQPAPAPGPAPAPAPSPAPVSGPTTTTTTKNSTPTTTTTTIKLTEKDLDDIPNCSSGKFGVTPETFTEMKIGNYTVHIQKTPAKNSAPLKCKK